MLTWLLQSEVVYWSRAYLCLCVYQPVCAFNTTCRNNAYSRLLSWFEFDVCTLRTSEPHDLLISDLAYKQSFLACNVLRVLLNECDWLVLRFCHFIRYGNTWILICGLLTNLYTFTVLCFHNIQLPNMHVSVLWNSYQTRTVSSSPCETLAVETLTVQFATTFRHLSKVWYRMISRICVINISIIIIITIIIMIIIVVFVIVVRAFVT